MAVCVKSEPERGSTLTSDAHSLQDRCIDRTEGVICVDSQHSGTARGLNDSQCSAGNDMAACKIKCEPTEDKVFSSGFTATMSETGQFKCEHKTEYERSVTACHKQLPGCSNQAECDIHEANESLRSTECQHISNDTLGMDQFQQFKLNDTGPDSRKSSGSLSALSEQRGINVGEKVRSCCECGKSFMNTAALTKHRKTHVTEKTYVCAQCGKGFTNHSYLKKHHRVHSGEKPFTCSECGQRFTVANSLKVHMRFHSGEKPYHCSECDAGFFTLSTFKNHVLNHSGEKPNVCRQCGKSFKDAASLRRHCHSEKPYSCSECGKSFTQAANLKIHMRIHSGEKPYSCTLCGKCFTQKSGFTIHIRTHSGEKPSICDYCGKGFKHISYLKRHLKIHSGEKSKEVRTLISNNECDRDSTHKDTAFALTTDETGGSECVDKKQMKIFECYSGCVPGQQTDPQSIVGDKTAVCKVKCEWDSCETGPALTTVSGVELQDHLRTDQIKTENADQSYDALPRQTKPHCVSTEEPTQLKCEWD